ncbi:hypothetical protein CON65_15960 [Bacillus pseudomycoides]|uniref:DUF2313 domain-containing protein n=1 Tax=Bacillus pseudomycoides TaxID=64104 RepID=A0AA91VB00_9BACI|nr:MULTISPECIES: putative phage tail protein [Bacillus]PEB56251.1 hypothetical protein COO03_01395 [Bacillus sp. AFS098217]PED81681.1 hypothetical protein CON65_15960 [Bacillus pseudomycoides]
MHAIQEQQWGQVKVRTWKELNAHQWECFRMALMESETDLTVQGVKVVQSGAVNELSTEMQTQGIRVEHSPAIMQTITEMITSIVVSKRDYKTDLLKYLPLYERKSAVFKGIMTSYDRELRNLEQSLEVVDRNIFLDTAIETLPIFERDLGIKPVKTLRYDQRREQISSRYRASFDQTTEETIKSVAKAYSNGEVEVNKTDTPGIYEIKFIGTIGIPNNLDGLKQALDIVMPAHLGLIYTFVFNPWDMWRRSTWGEVKDKTWNNLRVWDEAKE